MDHAVSIRSHRATLQGCLHVPPDAGGVVLFAHGSGSGRSSPRNRQVASFLQHNALGTLLFDLLTPAEDGSRDASFDIDLLTARLMHATQWMRQHATFGYLPLGYFGASTGAAVALRAAAQIGDGIKAVVSRGGRLDLAMSELGHVKTPTLLILGALDLPVVELNKRAFEEIHAPKEMWIVEGATHLFEEPGALSTVAEMATEWFTRYLISGCQQPPVPRTAFIDPQHDH